MDLKIVKFVQSGATPFLDEFFSMFTRFGEEIFFVCMFLILYWCVSYNYAFKFGLYYVTSVLFNNIAKMIVKRPRPWMASEDVVNKLPASGLSFPSGHSQGISCISTFIVYDIYHTDTKKSYKIVSLVTAIVLCLMVGYSRLYLGQHYLTDVIAGFAFGIGIILLLKAIEKALPTSFKQSINTEVIVSTISIVLILIITILQFKNFGLSYSAINKLYRYSGLFVSASVGYILSKRLVKDIQLDFYLKLIKMAIGLIVTFGLYALLNLLIVPNFVNFLIILFVGIIATFVYPYIFNLVVLKIRKE